MEDFIKDILWLTEYKITYFNGGKDNITARVEISTDTFVIQKTLPLEEELKETISYAIEEYAKAWLWFAKTFWDRRFIDYKGNTYSLMEYINWEIISEKDHNTELASTIAKYLGQIHNISHSQNLDKFNLWKWKHKNLKKFIQLAEKYNNSNPKYNDLLDEILSRKWDLKRVNNLPTWLIHWDPAFKNFILDKSGGILWIIDYEMMEVDDYLWDLVDMIRSHMKLNWFWKEEFKTLISAYESQRQLNIQEKENLENYLKMMILDTCTRYFLSLFDESEYSNHQWNKEDSIKKVKRCLWEFDKATLFFT